MQLADGGMSEEWGEAGDLAAARRLLCRQLLDHLDAVQPVLRSDIMQALAQEGKLFHQPATPLDGRWALVPFCLARTLCTHADPARGAAAALAMECLICATDLFDDVMDEDMTPLIACTGQARAVNVALALLAFPQRILLSLAAQQSHTSVALRLLDEVQRALLQAVAGQQWDVLAEGRLACELSRDDCLAIAAAKAGSLLGLAWRLAVLCAEVGEAQVERCTGLGRQLGIAAQLDNDAHDLSHLLQPAATGCQKSDLRRGKKTLPVVLAARSLQATHPLSPTEIDHAFAHLPQLATREQEVYLAALREGILTTWGLSLLYRERARESFHQIMGNGPVAEDVLQVLGLAEPLADINGW
ncbi:MAG TPA: polyprenyl synthetase family protein [Ktedonobacteraceae bacterium]